VGISTNGVLHVAVRFVYGQFVLVQERKHVAAVEVWLHSFLRWVLD